MWRVEKTITMTYKSKSEYKNILQKSASDSYKPFFNEQSVVYRTEKFALKIDNIDFEGRIKNIAQLTDFQKRLVIPYIANQYTYFLLFIIGFQIYYAWSIYSIFT